MVLHFQRLARRAVKVARLSALTVLAAAVLVAPQARAQQTDIPPPKSIISDPNGVDVLSGDASFSEVGNSIGVRGPGSLSSSRVRRASGGSIESLNAYVKIYDDGASMRTTLVLNGQSQNFSGAAGKEPTHPEHDAVGSFNYDATSSSGIIYTAPDGTKAVFSNAVYNPSRGVPAIGRLRSITYPTGEVVTYRLNPVSANQSVWKIESSLGYVLLTDPTELGPTVANQLEVHCLDTYCNPAISFPSQYDLGRSTTVSRSGPPGASSFTVTVTNAAGATARIYTMTGSSLWGGDTGYRVSSVSAYGATWTYTYTFTQDTNYPDPVDGIFTTTVTDPNGVKRIVKSRLSNGHVLSDQQGVTSQDLNGRKTIYAYQYDDLNPTRLGFGRMSKVTLPTGDAFEYTYDDYANIVSRKHLPKSGSTMSATEMKAYYSCRTTTAVPFTTICNQPDWVEDENGKRTDFTYDLDHGGGVSTITKPAGPNGIRPQTRYTYTSVRAYYSTAGGDMLGTPAWRVSQTTTCRTQTSCAGTADELVTDYVYESGQSYKHNARLISVTTRSGNTTGPGAVSSTTTYAYNPRGDVIETNGPLPGDTDLVITHYDNSRWLVGTVGADPDGSGTSLQHRATKTVYRADGQAQAIYTGVVADRLGDTFVNSFQVKSAVINEYDAYGRISAQMSAIGGSSPNTAGATYALTETSYDNLGRVDCVAQRMDSAQFASRPGACSGGNNGAGKDPDRITKTTYNKYGQVETVRSGLNVNEIYEIRNGYMPSGQLESVKDGEDNFSTYAYDDLGRLQFAYFPSATQKNTQNNADYESYGYDNAGYVISRRLRDDRYITTEYDQLGRASIKRIIFNGVTEKTYTYGYDNFNHPISTSDGTRTVTQSYDVSGCLVSESGGSGSPGTVSYECDAAGRRTKLSWPDQFSVTYKYDNAGALSYICRAGASCWDAAPAEKIAGFSYDDLGRRTSISRGTTTASTTYSYDPLNLLLQTITQNPNGTSDDVTYGLAYNLAGQIKSRTISNSAYAWNSAYTVDRPYTIDGLNRISDAGAKPVAPALTAPGFNTYGYDGRGNLTCVGSKINLAACSEPTTTYQYDSENRLKGTVNGPSLVYDPLGRLYQTTSNSGTVTRYLYDGVNLIGEYNSSNVVQRRYVFGTGADEVLAWFDATSQTEANLPRWLLADHQGSIIAELNNTGAATKKFTYDEYGAPGPSNVGLFQYTGQVYLSDLSLYHYKARAYSPTLGRFLQTDPTGYDDGLNWYAYVGNDPLNMRDPLGLAASKPCSSGDPGCGVVDDILICPSGSYAVGGKCAQSPRPPVELTLERPRPVKKPESRWSCAARTANQYSLAGLVGWTDSEAHPIGNALLGNTFSGVHDTINDFATLNNRAFARDLVLSGLGQGAPIAGALSQGSAGAVWKGAGGVTTDAVARLAATGGTRAFAATFANTVGFVKLGADAAIWGVSYAYCGQQ